MRRNLKISGFLNLQHRCRNHYQLYLYSFNCKYFHHIIYSTCLHVYIENCCVVIRLSLTSCHTHTHTHAQVSQLNTLITHLLGELTKGDRQKIMTICTIGVHAHDVVSKLIQQKVENSQAFTWLSQLRHRYMYSIDDLSQYFN